MSYDYYYSDQEEEEYQNQQIKDEEFDKHYDRLQEELKHFQNETGDYLFSLLNPLEFEKLIYKGHKSQLKLYDDENEEKEEEEEYVLPSITQYIPKPKTQQEIINERKSWITFDYEKPSCGTCKICQSNSKTHGRKRVCRNRGKMVSKSLYQDLFEIQPKTPPPPPPKTKLEVIVEKKNCNLKETGNAWGKQEKIKSVNINRVQQKQIEEEKLKKEEEQRKKKEEEQRKKREQEERIRREEERRQAAEKREYYRQQKYRNERQRKERFRNKKPNGRFSNMW
jgi:hypothetical protein